MKLIDFPLTASILLINICGRVGNFLVFVRRYSVKNVIVSCDITVFFPLTPSKELFILK